MRRPYQLLAWLVGVGVAGIGLGCSKDGPPKAESSPVAAAAPKAAAGPQGVIDQHCAKCHDGKGGRGKGPDLSHVGSEHDAAWIGDHIKNPKAHKPESRMPAFEGKLSPDDIRAVADHLAAMR